MKRGRKAQLRCSFCSSTPEPIEPKKHLFPLFLDMRPGHALRAMSRQLGWAIIMGIQPCIGTVTSSAASEAHYADFYAARAPFLSSLALSQLERADFFRPPTFSDFGLIAAGSLIGRSKRRIPAIHRSRTNTCCVVRLSFRRNDRLLTDVSLKDLRRIRTWILRANVAA
ncbi:hypothetical protein EDD18DRAFT_789653 [Armillaria luteobubalina]|uniref:Uncharacterized protein n=1 Tax=Armillaria luteobubalina TaxID=153913 RepID=A0AA39QDY8_9AGAR|nr:hypothetical protein EDD18DRAFT_789653 [Armillaria luteobubalina]